MDVVGIGSAIMDYLINIDEMPPQDGACGLKETSWQFGGKVATAMAAAARLGIKAGMHTVVSGDHQGTRVIKDFEFNGVDTSRIIRDLPETTNPYCISISETVSKTRRFMGDSGTARRMNPQDLDFEYIKSATYLHVESGNPTSRKAVEFAKENGVKVVIDADSFSQDIADMAHLVDVFIASEHYYNAAFTDGDYKTNCKKLYDAGSEIVIFTRGSKGCVVYYQDEYFEIPVFKNVKVKDTTGAGDVFHGAYIAGLCKGLDPIECANFASACSTIKCMAIGGRAGLPTYEMLQKFMQSGEIDFSVIEKRVSYYSVQ